MRLFPSLLLTIVETRKRESGCLDHHNKLRHRHIIITFFFIISSTHFMWKTILWKAITLILQDIYKFRIELNEWPNDIIRRHSLISFLPIKYLESKKINWFKSLFLFSSIQTPFKTGADRISLSHTRYLYWPFNISFFYSKTHTHSWMDRHNLHSLLIATHMRLSFKNE
jgi:hypothetical protein